MSAQFHVTDPRAEQQQINKMCGEVRSAIDAKLPIFLRPFLTWFTGCPVNTIEQRRNRTWRFYVAVPLAQIAVGTSISWIACLQMTTPPAVLITSLGILSTTAGLGMMQVSVFHYCAHYTLLSSNVGNRKLGRLVSSIVFLGDFDAYRAKHMRHHNRHTMLDEEDEFTEFLIHSLRLVPGAPKSQLWLRVVKCTLSPAFHLKLFWKRLLLTYIRPDYLSVVSRVAWFVVLMCVYLTRSWIPFLVSVAIPLIITFQISIIVRTLCEHVLPSSSMCADRPKDFISHATRAIYAGIAPPSQRFQGDVLGWVLWLINMMTLQLVFRVVILVGDAACHDLHHRKPGSRDWPNYMVARCQEYYDRTSAGKEPFPEVWGLFAAVDSCLETVSKMV